MADLLIDLMLSKQELPQLSDSDLTLLNNSYQQGNDQINFDCFDLDTLDDFFLENQSNELELIDPNSTLYNDQNLKYSNQNNSNTYQHLSNFTNKEQISPYLIGSSPQHTSLITNDLSNNVSNEQRFANSANNISFKDFSTAHEIFYSPNCLMLDDSQSSLSNQFEDYRLTFLSLENADQSIDYLSQIINSSINDQIYTNQADSPVDYCYNQQTNSLTDYQTINSPIDYPSSVSTFNVSCSTTNSPSSNESYTDSSESYENHYSNYVSHSYDKLSPSSTSNVKPKRKRSKKVVSEEEIKRKLELKAERRRKRLERKKVQNKEAARRYREKKKMEEDQINHRLMNVKNLFDSKRKQLKDILNEKKVLIKLLKDFADQSKIFNLPPWMMQSNFSNLNLL